jgi:hypothetical protein
MPKVIIEPLGNEETENKTMDWLRKTTVNDLAKHH